MAGERVTLDFDRRRMRRLAGHWAASSLDADQRPVPTRCSHGFHPLATICRFKLGRVSGRDMRL